MLEVGDQVDGRYVVDARIGAGGMAEVYRVRHLSLGSVHALKVLLLPHPGLRERFLREGRIQAQIRHPNVVAVTDVLEHRGKLGLLMEYVDHVSLQQLLDSHGALPLDQALTLFAHILSGVSAAHASGVLHRDIKPANILLARTPQGLIPKITDFGIAKVVLEGAPPGATRDGSMMGTPGYMAPEQVSNAADVDRRVDVFALGALLYAVLAGKPAFRPDSPEVFDDTLAGRFPPLDGLVPGLPAHVVQAVHRALTPNRDDRFADCAELAAALFVDRPELLHLATHTLDAPQPILSEGPLTLPASSMSTLAPAPPTDPGTAATLVREPAGRPRWALAAIALVGVLVTLALLTMRPDPTPPAEDLPAATPTPPAPAPASPVEAPPVIPATEAAPPAPEAAPAVSATAKATGPTSSASSSKAVAAVTAPEASPPEAAPSAPAEVVVAPSAPAEVAAAPEAAAPEVAAPAVEIPRLTGTWTGTANRLPATLRITGQSGAALSGELRLTVGATAKVIALKGSIDPDTGAVRLEESGGDRMVLTGSLAGDRLSGSYMKAGQSKALGWEVNR